MSADIQRVLFSRTEYRQTTPLVDNSVKTRDTLATELEYKTNFLYLTDANAFASDVLALRKVARFDWELYVRRTPAYDAIQLGDTITLKYPRFGLASGGNFIVKKKGWTLDSGLLSLSLYGPQ